MVVSPPPMLQSLGEAAGLGRQLRQAAAALGSTVTIRELHAVRTHLQALHLAAWDPRLHRRNVPTFPSRLLIGISLNHPKRLHCFSAVQAGPAQQAGKKEAHGIIKGPGGTARIGISSSSSSSSSGGGLEERGELMSDMELLRETSQ